MRPNKTDASDFIDDRALRDADTDRFRLIDFVTELESLVTTVDTPANIALFGPWGSGKTSLSNLLEQRLKGRTGVRFVRFDAFKYAETPLRRHFISQLAASLGRTDTKFTEGLYTAKADREFKVPYARLLQHAGLFIGLFVALTIVLLLFQLAWLSFFSNAPLPDLLTLQKEHFGIAALGAAIFSVFLSIAGKPVIITTTTSAPSSEEQFEKLFRELVGYLKPSRLVVLIDELDRCSSQEVVTVLETLKTFLEVPDCVFIVAADQHVLETALSTGLRQSTPVNERNPQYSAGSEFLDKIFQYQISLPPLTTRRLTRFALELVREKSGIWSQVDREEVVSVLVPTHVRSPRRVKTLLNAFALAARATARRQNDGVLSGDLSERGGELAKLVCLRHEFPLFARDLTLDWRLPDLVLGFHEDSEYEPELIRPEVRERARSYAGCSEPVDVQLGAASEEAEEDDGEDDAQQRKSAELGRASQVESSQGQLLIRYLQKTSYVTSPRRDLIYLESSGAPLDLDPSIAEQLEDEAVNGRTAAVLSIVEQLPDDARLAAFRMLGHTVKEAAPGIEGDNAVTALLAAVGAHPDAETEQFVDELADAVAVHARAHSLRDEDLTGAFVLGLESKRVVGRTLVREVLASTFAREDPDLGLLIISRAADLSASDRVTASDALAQRLTDSATVDDAIAKLAALPEDVAASVVVGCKRALAQVVQKQSDAEEESDDGTKLPDPLSACIEALASFDGASIVKEALAEAILSIDDQRSRSAVEGILGEHGVIRSETLTATALVATGRRVVRLWPRWLESIDPGICSAEPFQEQIDSLVSSAIAKSCNPQADKNERPTLEQFAEVMGLLSNLRNADRLLPTDVAAPILSAFAVATDLESLSEQNRLWSLLAQMEEHAGFDVSSIAPELAEALSAQIRSQVAGEELLSEAVLKIREWANFFGERAEEQTVKDLSEIFPQSPWLVSPNREVTLLELFSAAELEDPVGAEGIESLETSLGDDAAEPLAVWLARFPPPVAVAFERVRRYLDQDVPAPLVAGLESYMGQQDGPERLEFVKLVLSDALSQEPSSAFLDAIRYTETDQAGVADEILRLYGETTNRSHRATILRLWKALNPSDERVRKQLIERVFIPLAASGHQGFLLCYSNIGLALPPPYGVLGAVRDTMLEEGTRHDHRPKVETKLHEAGILKRKGWLRRSYEPSRDE